MWFGLWLFFILIIQNGCTHELGDNCVTRDKSKGVCTPAWKCASAFQKNGTIPTLCKKEDLLICCKTNEAKPASNRTNKPRTSVRKCTMQSKQLVEYIPLIPIPIEGGIETFQAEFPHMAAIGWIDLQDKTTFHCGGSLISPRFVLSAAHCTWNPRLLRPKPTIIRLGDHDLDPAVYDGMEPINVAIKTAHKHPQYKSPNKYNDIAIFELVFDLNFNGYIRPACLWNLPEFAGHSEAMAIGWGEGATPESKSTALQKVSLTLLENDFCDPLLLDLRNRHWRGFATSQLCAGELHGGKDTCRGDSGSPLQFESQGLHYIIGITSFGPRCAESGLPAVYTRVSSYLDWIESVVWPEE